MISSLTTLMQTDHESRPNSNGQRKAGLSVKQIGKSKWAIMEGSAPLEGRYTSQKRARHRMNAMREECAVSDWFLYQMPART